MKSFAQVCLLIQAAAPAAGCSSAEEPSAATLDLLARSPEEDVVAGVHTSGVHTSTEQRLARLEPGAVARYRIEPRVPGEVHLAARANGGGTLEAAWFAIDLTSGEETPRATWSSELPQAGDIERDFPLPAELDLTELRLTWHAPAGGAELELQELALQESQPVERPSIVLIVIDTLSATHLSAYGYPLETDPELVRFASESFLFERCFANAPWTVPSIMSLLSGVYARAHALDPLGSNLLQQWHLSESRWTLAESLRAGGYRTAGFVDTVWLQEGLGVRQGFDVYDMSAAEGLFGEQGKPEGGIRHTTALARAFLESLGPRESSFLFVHALDVHGPYLATPSTWPHAPESEPYDLEQTAHAGGSAVAFGIIPTYLARGEVPAGELPNPMRTASLARAYDAGIRFVDEELGKFFGFLRERGILERSWVVITADHGEMIADSRFVFGHGVLDQDVMHVPLLIRPPGGYPGGKRIADAVQLVDLQPTLVELAGCAADARLHGRSLVPLLRSEARTSDVVLAEGGIVRQAMLIADGWKLVELEPAKESTLEARISNPLLARNFPPLAELDAKSERPRRRNLRWLDDLELRCDVFERMPATGLTDELLAQMKTRHGFPSFLVFIDDVLEGPFYELYDLTADPEAKHDVAAQHPEKVAALQALLGQEKRRRAKAWKLAQPPAKPVEFAPEEIQALEALGYVGDDE